MLHPQQQQDQFPEFYNHDYSNFLETSQVVDMATSQAETEPIQTRTCPVLYPTQQVYDLLLFQPIPVRVGIILVSMLKFFIWNIRI